MTLTWPTRPSRWLRLGNTFGRRFRITTYGESHGPGVGVVVDGCPARLELSEEDIQGELDRRRPGQSKLVTQRQEKDRVRILSGVSEGLTLGTPIALHVDNEDARGRDYEEMRQKYRPSHADYAYDAKYGIRAASGGGRASARETVGRVAAGAIAQMILRERWGVSTLAWVERVKDISTDREPASREEVDASPTRCPDPVAAERIQELIEATRKAGDSVGGVVRCICRGVPAGWGEPVFDKLEAELAKAQMSLPASKGFEIGSGFGGTYMTGREHNDAYRAEDGEVVMPTNRSGGIQGGISVGAPLDFRVAFKPTATIMHEQDTVTVEKENTTLKGRGRHDPCVLPRAIPMVEAMAALVLVDAAMLQADLE